ncbi:GNAT family N-acetyltransferase [Brevundimonas variabilis]|uniref:Putative N-acetyltransferase YhbS n=1 Tax=Brevundimonas variabilis TaxID=74312 RepID=A0A7W9FGH9_9CAUL|nr:N-acetyltransferase [Brevundimonas variabilis]MBB5746459.1 putative N-acetyltransferase YhbS [Brevundimonas variabilis]
MSAPAVALTPLRISPETPFDRAAIEGLVLRAFGPGRFAKTAERLREQSTLAAGFVARDGDRIVGSVRLWAITVAGHAAVFLGPIAVEADRRGGGLGADLVQACVDHARSSGVAGVLLVGDLPYFARFGFEPAPSVTLPGPVDRRRVMWLPLTEPVPTGAAKRG